MALLPRWRTPMQPSPRPLRRLTAVSPRAPTGAEVTLTVPPAPTHPGAGGHGYCRGASALPQGCTRPERPQEGVGGADRSLCAPGRNVGRPCSPAFLPPFCFSILHPPHDLGALMVCTS